MFAFLKQQPSWLSEAQWRAMRTLVQVFAGACVPVLYAVLTAYQTLHTFDWSLLWYGGVIGGLIALAAWWMNRS